MPFGSGGPQTALPCIFFFGGREPTLAAIRSAILTIAVSEANARLKEEVRAFWQAHPCGTKFADAEPGTRRFYELVEKHRYDGEWHIPAAAGFADTRGSLVLEIGCGLGTDGAQFAKAGAEYTGVDLTEAAIELARRRFELFNLPGHFQTADAERLEFADETFDVVYSHGVLHHTPDPETAVSEIHRVLKRGGRIRLPGFTRGKRPGPFSRPSVKCDSRLTFSTSVGCR